MRATLSIRLPTFTVTSVFLTQLRIAQNSTHNCVWKLVFPVSIAPNSAMAATMLTMSHLQLAVMSPLSEVSFGRLSARRPAFARMVCMATPMGSSGPAIDKTGDKVADKIEEAQEICAEDGQSEECATAWNAVESATAEKASGKPDPLEEFCEENPEADECRVYND